VVTFRTEAATTGPSSAYVIANSQNHLGFMSTSSLAKKHCIGFWARFVEFIMAMLGRARERKFKGNGTPTATFSEVQPVIYLDRRLFGAAGWRLSALAVDPVILQLAWRGFEAVERLERRIYTQFEEEAEEEGAVSY
jgi:hypothetical protein